MKKYAIAIVILLWLEVLVLGQRGRYDFTPPGQSFWKRVGTNLSPKTVGDEIDLETSKLKLGDTEFEHENRIHDPVYLSGQTGLDDVSSSGTYSLTGNAVFQIRIVSTGTPDNFEWRKATSVSWTGPVAMTGSAQLLQDSVFITWTATTGHTLNDEWEMNVGNEVHVSESVHVIGDITSDGDMVVAGVLRSLSPVRIAGGLHLLTGAAPGITTDKMYNVGGDLFWDGIDLSSAGTTIEFTSTFDNTLITKLSGNTNLVYDKPNPAQGETAVNGGTVTKVGKFLMYQFHVVFDEDDEFVLVMDTSLIPGEIVSMSLVCDDASPENTGFRSPGARQIRFNRLNTIDVDVDAHLIVWVDGGTETAIIPVGTFTGTAGSIPFSNGTSIVEDNANLFYDDVNNQLGIGTTSPSEKLQIEGNNAALKLQDDSGNWARIKVGNSQLTIEADPDNITPSTDIVFKMDGSEKARFYQGGNFGIGTTAPDAKLEVNGYTMLGSDAPKIKVKKLTGTLAPADSNLCANDYADKVLSAIPVVLSGGMYLPPEYTGNANMKYSFYWNTTNFTFRGVDAGIQSSPYVITVIYEE